LPIPMVPDQYATLSAMISPAIFLTANGSLIISTSNRMSRVVDRIRILNDQGDKLCRGSDLDYPRERMDHIQDQLRRLIQRSDRIRYALTLLYLAFSSFVLTSLTLALDVHFSNRIPWAPTAFAILGVSLMLGASYHLVREALQALASNRLEIRFFNDLHQRRMSSSTGCQF
jgi:hypothetical protein